MLRIDLMAPDGWERVSQDYRAALPFQDPSTHVQIYPGYQPALWEVTRSLASFFSHKKTIAIPENAEPALQSLAVSFSEDGYTVKTLSAQEIAEPASWFAALQAELLFVLLPEDDPVTGRLYSYEKLNEAFKDKRVFRVFLSHAAFRFRILEKPSLYEARILSLQSDRALLMAGERCRVRAQVAPLMDWNERPGTGVQSRLQSAPPELVAEWKSRIAAFEANLPEGFRAFFSGEEPRIFDRAVIWHPTIDGSALIAELAEDLRLSLASPGSDNLLEAMSGCRWQSVRYQEWLEKKGLTLEQQRGLIVLSAEILRPDLRDRLIAAAQKITALQG